MPPPVVLLDPALMFTFAPIAEAPVEPPTKTMSPASPEEDAPEEMVTWPLEPDTEFPDPTLMAPLLTNAEPDALNMSTPPDVVALLAPLNKDTLPPVLDEDDPPTRVTLDPWPLPLLPTDKEMAPALVLAEPVERETEPVDPA